MTHPEVEPGRLAAHVYLDTAVAWTPGRNGDPIVDLAWQRMNDVGAVAAQYDDETDEVVVDATQLTGGTLVLVDVLIDRIVAVTGLDREVVIAQTREALDQRFADRV